MGTDTDAQDRACDTCRHLFGGQKAPDGTFLTSQKCRKFKAGATYMFTWTAVHNMRKCGPQRGAWEPKA